MAEAPPSVAPKALIVQGLHTLVATRLEGERDYLKARRAVVQAAGVAHYTPISELFDADR